MRVFQATSILAVFGCLVTLAGARVPKAQDNGIASGSVQNTKDEVVAQTKPSVRDAEDKSFDQMKPRDVAEKPVCCTPGCLACTVEDCDEDECTTSIWFAACCAEALHTTIFFDRFHNPLNVTEDEFYAMRGTDSWGYNKRTNITVF